MSKSAHTINIVGAGKVDIVGDKEAVDYIVSQYIGGKVEHEAKIEELELLLRSWEDYTHPTYKQVEARIAELKGENDKT